ncbi:MAG TPA: biotin/lipoyl-binding protein, partial [Candidatus Aminicenantes bacterium]|nr:biotin/lipoyl-binding protein [Candidatus Aminicenantes bacterium]
MKRGLGLGVLIVLCACGGRSVRNEIILTGSVESDPVRVSPLVGGRLLEVAAVEGTRVGAGGIIARIDATDLELQL